MAKKKSFLKLTEEMKKDKDVKTYYESAYVDIKEELKGDSPVAQTGSLCVDRLIRLKNGGVPRGGITEIFGLEASGKTTLATNVMVTAQRSGGLAALLDFEQAFNYVYAEGQGLSLSEENFFYSRPTSMEEGWAIIEKLVKSKMVDVIVCDSVSAMTPKAILEGEIDQIDQPGIRARLLSRNLSRIIKILKESNTALILINQVRSNIKTSRYDAGPMTDTTGGKALKFYASLRIDLKKKGVETVEIASVMGEKRKQTVRSKVLVKTIKNKIAEAEKEEYIYIQYGEGIDNVRSLIDLGVAGGLITKSGAKYTILATDNCEEKSCIGIEVFRAYLKNNTKVVNDLYDGCISFLKDLDIKNANRHAKKVKSNEDADVPALIKTKTKAKTKVAPKEEVPNA